MELLRSKFLCKIRSNLPIYTCNTSHRLGIMSSFHNLNTSNGKPLRERNRENQSLWQNEVNTIQKVNMAHISKGRLKPMATIHTRTALVVSRGWRMLWGTTIFSRTSLSSGHALVCIISRVVSTVMSANYIRRNHGKYYSTGQQSK